MDAEHTPIPELSIAIPSYAEADNLRVMLPQLTEALDGLSVTYEILVIDTERVLDDTRAVCAGVPAVKCVARTGGEEYGNAIRTGIAVSSAPWVVIMDIDGSHDPAFIKEMMAIRDRADVVIASRYTDGGSTDNPWLLVALSRLLNRAFSIVLKMGISDVSNSFRLYRGDLLRSITLKSMHFDIQEEILARLLWDTPTPARVVELPFRFGQRLHGESKRRMTVFIWVFITAMFRLWALKRSMHRRSSKPA